MADKVKSNVQTLSFCFTMQLFSCDHCQHPVYFENTSCENCGCALGFDVKGLGMKSLTPAADDPWWQDTAGRYYRYCSNHHFDVCNWLIPKDQSGLYCAACMLNRTIPDLGQASYYQRWKTIETAKHRLVYTLLRWRLPVVSKMVDQEKGF